MNKREYLLDQIDNAQARIDELCGKVINTEASEKGFKEMTDGYNKWIDILNGLYKELEKLDDVDLEKEKLELEKKKLEVESNLEKEKLAIERQRVESQEEIEQDKLNLERDKFAYDVKKTKIKEPIDYILRGAEIGVKVLVPFILGGCATKIADISYKNDMDFKLCNGNVKSMTKTLMDLARFSV